MYSLFVLIISVVVLTFLIMKCKLHAFFSLIITCVVVAGLSGYSLAEAVSLTTQKFGNSAGNIAVVIGLAVVSGELMDKSGAAEKIARSILKVTGDKKAPLAMVGSGYLLSIPLFSDTCYYLLIPIAKALSLSSGKSFVAMIVAMSCGALATHCLVPPTPGPLAVSQTLNVDLGLTMLIGMIIALFTSICGGWFYGKWISNRLEIPRERFAGSEVDEGVQRELPPLVISLLPIVIPVVLVAGNTLTSAFLPGTPVAKVFGTIGQAVIALGISVLVSYIILGMMRGKNLKELSALTEHALSVGGVCILITAAGGAYGGMLVECGIGTTIIEMFHSAGVSPIIFAYLLTLVLRTCQGSCATAMITVSAMLAPMIPDMGLSFHPVYIVMAIATGSMTFSWMNGSGFWVFAKLCNMSEKETLLTTSISSLVMSIVGLIVTLIMSFIFPLV